MPIVTLIAIVLAFVLQYWLYVMVGKRLIDYYFSQKDQRIPQYPFVDHGFEHFDSTYDEKNG